MTFSTQQIAIAALALIGVTVLAIMRVVNGDAALVMYSAVLGAVLNSTLPKGGQPAAQAPSPVTVVNQPRGEDGEGEVGLVINILLIVILVIVILKLLES